MIIMRHTQALIKSKFIDPDILRLYHTKLYTDGSESSGGAVCAVIHKDAAYASRLLDYVSICTAKLAVMVTALDLVLNSIVSKLGKYSDSKLAAMVTALYLVLNSIDSKFVIYSNSRRALEAIKKFSSYIPLVQEVQEWPLQISCWHKSVYFCWIHMVMR